MTSFYEWREQGVGGDVRQGSKEVEERSEVVDTEGGKEGKSKVVASCRYLEQKFQECSTRGGVPDNEC